MNENEYKSFFTTIGCFLWNLYKDPKRGDLYAVFYKPVTHSKLCVTPEQWGCLLWCAESVFGVDPLSEVGDEFQIDLAPRQEFRQRLKEEIRWFDTIPDLVSALFVGRWGMGLYGRLLAFREFRAQVADYWKLGRPRRDLAVDPVTFSLVEYDPFEGFDGYHLTPALAVYAAQLPRAAKANYQKMGAESRKPFTGEGDLREDQETTLEILSSRVDEVIEAAVEEFGDDLYIESHSLAVFNCLVEAKEQAAKQPRFVLAPRTEQDRPTEHYPYKSRGMPEGDKMRPDLKRVI